MNNKKRSPIGDSPIGDLFNRIPMPLFIHMLDEIERSDSKKYNFSHADSDAQIR